MEPIPAPSTTNHGARYRYLKRISLHWQTGKLSSWCSAVSTCPELTEVRGRVCGRARGLRPRGLEELSREFRQVSVPRAFADGDNFPRNRRDGTSKP
ncbi:MAG: hypothetical protein ACLU3I_21935 [Acutalibacteraceae bacterium]